MKVLVALLTCSKPKYAERRKFSETTWGSRMPAGYTFESFDGERLGVPDDYASLCLKTRAICRYAIEQDFDWMIKVDDDTFVRTEQLEIPTDCDYAGHCATPPFPPPYCSGCFYWLSRRSFSIIAESPMDPRWTCAEDQWVGWNLAQQGIHPKSLREVVLWPPDCPPEEGNWLACCKWDVFSPDLFKRFEKRYGYSHL